MGYHCYKKENSLFKMGCHHYSKRVRGIENSKKKKKSALLANLAWRVFKSPKAIWAQILLNKYLTRKNVYKYSRIWTNILKGWEHCQKGLKWKIEQDNISIFGMTLG